MSRKIGLLTTLGFAGLVLAAVACYNDPLAEGRDAVERFTTNPSFANVKVADSTFVTAIAVNIHGEPTGDAVTGAPCDNKITVAVDPTRTVFEPPERFVVKGVTAGNSCLNISGGGKTTTVTIRVVP
jgi:hypothetical protein